MLLGVSWVGWSISAYAAIVATVALAWQVRLARRARRTELKVHLSLGRKRERETDREFVTAHVRIVNLSQHNVTVEQVTLEGECSPTIPMSRALGGYSDRAVPALDGISDGHLLEWDGTMDWEKPVRARVLLKTGSWFDSAPGLGLGPPPREARWTLDECDRLA